MIQHTYAGADKEPRTAYEFTPDEFKIVVDNLTLFGHAAKRALTLSYDTRRHVRPRTPALSKDVAEEANELLAEVLNLGDKADQTPIQPTAFDVLRAERKEVMHARLHQQESGLEFDRNNVVVGLATVASALNDLRGPIIDDSQHLVGRDILVQMLDQFHEEGVERILANQ